MVNGKNRSVLPGFGLSVGYTVIYLSLVVLIPLSAVVVKTGGMGWKEFWGAVSSRRMLAAYRLSFGASLIAAGINAVFGIVVAWMLVRYRFVGRRIVDAMIDLPFAIPTAVAGISLAAIYSPNGWLGQYLERWGVKVAFGPLGVVVALTFIGMPFVVRTVQPVLEGLSRDVEEAAASLGAGRWKTFTRVIMPELMPALLTGGMLAFARGLGEYGSVVFIAGNMPGKSEIVPLMIITKLDQYDYGGATAIATVMMGASFVLLLGGNWVQRKLEMRRGQG